MFDWIGFNRTFPFGDLSDGDRRYRARVLEEAGKLQGEEKAALLDLLDLQWRCFLEQARMLHERRLAPDLHITMVNAAGRLQANDELRAQLGLRTHA